MADNVISIAIRAKDEASKAMRDIAKEGQTTAGVLGKLAIAGAAAFGAFKGAQQIGQAVTATKELGSAVSKLSRETGLSAEESSRFVFMLGKVGLEADDASRALGVFSKGLVGITDIESGAIAGGKKTANVLAELGIQAFDAAGAIRPMAQLIPEIADQFANLQNGPEKTALALQLFGKSGKELIPLLNLGSKGMADLAKQSDRLGLTLTGKNVASIKRYVAAQRDMDAAFDGLRVTVGLALMPLLAAFATTVAEVAASVNTYLRPAVEDLAAVIGRVLSPAFERVVDTVSTFADLIKSALTGDVEKAAAAFNKLPVPLQGVAIALALIYEVGQQVVEAFKDLFDVGRDALGFLSGLRDKFLSVTPAGESFVDQLVRLGDQKEVIRAIGIAIAGFVAVLAVQSVLSFATAMGALALNFLTFPVRLALSAAEAVANFVGAAAGLVSKAVDITMNVVGTALDVAQTLAGLAGKVISVTINAVGNAIQFLQGLASGALQRLIDALPPIEIPAVLKSERGTLDFAPQGKVAGKSFLDGFRASFNASTLQNVFSNVLSGIAGGLAALAVEAGLIATIGGAIAASAVPLAIAAAALGAILIEAFVAKLVFDAQGLPGLITFLFGGLIGLGIKAALPAIGDAFAALPGIIGEVVGRSAVVFATLPFVILAVMIKGIQTIAPKIIDAFSRLGTDIFTGLSLSITAAIPKITAAFSVAFDPRTYIEIVKKLLEQLALTIADPTRLLEGIHQLGLGIESGFAEAAQLAVQAFFSGIGALKAVVEFVTGVVEAVFGDFYRRLVQGARDQWQTMNDIVHGKLNDFVAFIGNALLSAYSAVLTIGGIILDWFQELPFAITVAIGDLKGVLFEFAQNAIQGFLDGVISKATDLFNSGKDAMGNFLSGIGTGLLSHSPSQAMHEYGVNAMVGFQQGIDAGAGGVFATLDRIMADVRSRVDQINNEAQRAGGGRGGSGSGRDEGRNQGFSAAEKHWINEVARQRNQPIPYPGYQMGTSYVPKTGLALLHRGEEVIPARKRREQQENIGGFENYGTVQIVLPNVQEPQDFARELDRYFRE